MSQDKQSPLTVIGDGKDSQNPQGKWYNVIYRTDSYGWDVGNQSDEIPSVGHPCELLFIPSRGSIAKHIRKYVKEHSYHEDSGTNGLPEGCTVRVEKLALLSSGGEIVGFKPKSIEHLFPENYGDEGYSYFRH